MLHMVCVNYHYSLPWSSLGGMILLLIDVYNYQAQPHFCATH